MSLIFTQDVFIYPGHTETETGGVNICTNFANFINGNKKYEDINHSSPRKYISKYFENIALI